MDGLKKPDTLLSLATVATLVGGSVYYYKRLNVMDARVAEVEASLQMTVAKLGETATHGQQLNRITDAVRELHTATEQRHAELSNLLSSQQAIIVAILDSLEENGISVRLPVRSHGEPRREWEGRRGEPEPPRREWEGRRGEPEPPRREWDYPEDRSRPRGPPSPRWSDREPPSKPRSLHEDLGL